MPFRRFTSDRLTALHLTGAGLMALAAILVCFESWREIFLEFAYRDEEYQHIFIVPFVAVAMIWVRRMRFRHCRPTGTLLGPLLMLAGWALSYYGFNRQTTSAYHLGGVLVMLGAVVSVLGKTVLFRFAPAVLVLLFLVPVPGQLRQAIAIPLQDGTAQVSKFLLDLMGVESDLSGNLLTVNGKPVMIAEACNGMRMVFPLLLIGYGFAFALPLRQSVRVLIILFSPVVAIACNVVRAVPTIWLAGNHPEIYPAFHSYSGWVMLPIAFMLLLILIKILEWAMVPVKRYTLASQ